MEDFLGYFRILGPLQLIGVVGFLFYIFSFAGVQLGFIDGNGLLYTACNIIAATLVGLSLFSEFNLSSALIQASWIAIGLIGLVRRLKSASVRAASVPSGCGEPSPPASSFARAVR